MAEWRTLVARSRSGLVALLLVWLTGCAAVAPHRHPAFEGEGARTDPEVARCVGFWRSLDDAIDGARVRDGQEVRVSGRPYLRANRLAISVFETYEQIVTRCCEAWNFFANDTTTIRSITSREYAKAVKS